MLRGKKINGSKRKKERWKNVIPKRVSEHKIRNFFYVNDALNLEEIGFKVAFGVYEFWSFLE